MCCSPHMLAAARMLVDPADRGDVAAVNELQDQLGLKAGSAQPFVMDGFWSISVYNAAGYFELNDRGAYSLNNITAAPSSPVVG